MGTKRSVARKLSEECGTEFLRADGWGPNMSDRKISDGDVRRLRRLAENRSLLSSWEINFCWECSHAIKSGDGLTPGQRSKLMEIEMERLQ